MTKIDLPPKGSWNRTLAVAIWGHIQAPNPHGPQADLSFDMPYCRDYAEHATVIANDLIEKGWRPPADPTRQNVNLVIEDLIKRAHGHVSGQGLRMDVDEVRRILRLAYEAGEQGRKEPITAEALNRLGPPSIIEPSKDIVALVSAISNETVDMTVEQALDLRLLLSIKGHQSDLYLVTGEELWLRCTCGKFDVIVGAQQGDLEALTAGYIAHLKAVVNAPKLADLPDGTYNDGTYDWEKEGSTWTPLRAPSGMPTQPDITRLRRVIVTKHYEDI